MSTNKELVADLRKAQARIEELEAENKALREAAEDLAGDCERHVKFNCELLSENKRIREAAQAVYDLRTARGPLWAGSEVMVDLGSALLEASDE